MQLMSIARSVRETGIPRSIVEKYIREGLLPFEKPGKRDIFVDKDKLLEVYEAHSAQNAEEKKKKFEATRARPYDFLEGLRKAREETVGRIKEKATVVALPKRKKKAFDFEGGINRLLKESHQGGRP